MSDSLRDKISFELGANGKFEPVTDEIVDLVFVDGAENQDRNGKPSFPQLHPLLKTRDAQTVDAPLNSGFGRPDQTMAIGIRFNEKTKAGNPDHFSDLPEVLQNLIEIDLDPGGVGILIHRSNSITPRP